MQTQYKIQIEVGSKNVNFWPITADVSKLSVMSIESWNDLGWKRTFLLQ